MADRANPAAPQQHTVTPRLVYTDASTAIEFYKAAFGATEPEPPHFGPAGRVVHAQLALGDSMFFLTDESDPESEAVGPHSAGDKVTAIMMINVADVDSLWQQAVAAGCEVIFPLQDQFYGQRSGRLRDPFGHLWILSSDIEDIDREEIDRRMRDWAEGAS